MGNLTDHAERELRKAGLFDKNSDYGGMLGEAVMKLVRVHAAEGHSGMSHAMVIDLFRRVADFKTLSPITANPEEWQDVSDVSGRPLWQSRRQPSVFSEDGGKTWRDNDEKHAESFESQLRALLNTWSKENSSNTPDFVLCRFMAAALEAFDAAVNARDHWYGFKPSPGTNTATNAAPPKPV